MCYIHLTTVQSTIVQSTNPVCHSFWCLIVTMPRYRKMMQSINEASVLTPYFTVVCDFLEMFRVAKRLNKVFKMEKC